MVSQAHSDPIHTAVENDDLAEVRRIIAAEPMAVNAQTAGGSTPLHLAVGMKNLEMVKCLLDNGADIQMTTEQGYTPLHWAAFFDAGSIATFLISRGAEIEVKAKGGISPLQLAMSQEAKQVVAALMNQTKAVYVEPVIDDRYNQAEKARLSGDLQASYKLLGELLRDDPENQKINFAYGMTCIAMKDYPRARLAFERILMKNPGNYRARVELARAQAAAGQYDSARQNLKEVLDQELGEDVRRNVERYLSQVDRHSKKSAISVRLDAGVLDDSNVNVGPDSEIISIAPIIFGSYSIAELAITEESMPTESTGQFASLRISGLYDLGSTGSWLAFADLVVYANELDDAAEYETQYVMASFGGNRTFNRSVLRMPLRYSHIETGGDPLVDMIGTAPLYSFSTMGGRASLTTAAVLEMRDYVELDDRDGVFGSIGESVKMISEDGKASATMGLTFAHDNTDSAIYRYDSVGLNLAVDQVGPFGVILYGRLASKKSIYAEKESLSPEPREDSLRQYTLGATRRLGKHFGVDVNYQVTRNTSTFALYQYERDVATASVYCSF